MPVARENPVVLKQEITAQVALEPVFNIFNSLTLLIKARHFSGFSDWVYKTAERMDKKLSRNHRLVFEGLHYALTPEQSLPSFPDYIHQMAAVDPLYLRNKLFDAYLRVDCTQIETGKCFKDTPDEMDPESVLGSAEDYIRFLEERFGKGEVDEEMETASYSLVSDPPAMQKFIVAHLWNIWDRVMAKEWARVEPMLQGSVRAFEKVDLQDRSILEAAELVLDIDLQSNHEILKGKLENVHKLTFIPSAHIGPYQFDYGFGTKKWLIFGARIPQGMTPETPELKRTEVLVRINALSDETRLKILQLIAATGSMTSSEIMTHLDLSQSAASRHLMQLSATGYLNASTMQGTKHYTINPNRIEETMQAVTAFLLNK
jgi:DNA-binding transcriptional ArsR family regulator